MCVCFRSKRGSVCRTHAVKALRWFLSDCWSAGWSALKYATWDSIEWLLQLNSSLNAFAISILLFRALRLGDKTNDCFHMLYVCIEQDYFHLDTLFSRKIGCKIFAENCILYATSYKVRQTGRSESDTHWIELLLLGSSRPIYQKYSQHQKNN